jgi:hypothetical protein
VKSAVVKLLEEFEIFKSKDAFSLYVPTPIDVWLKRSSTFSSYKFVRNRMEVREKRVMSICVL